MIYEVLYILPSKYSDNEVEGVSKEVNTMLENAGALILKSEVAGKLKLAYNIKGNQHGTYILAYIEVDGAKLAKIDQDMRLSDNVVRHVIVKREKGIPSNPFRLTSYQAPLTPEGKRAVTEERAPRRQTETPAEVQTKLTVEELYKKLDEILDTDLSNV